MSAGPDRNAKGKSRGEKSSKPGKSPPSSKKPSVSGGSDKAAPVVSPVKTKHVEEAPILSAKKTNVPASVVPKTSDAAATVPASGGPAEAETAPSLMAESAVAERDTEARARHVIMPAAVDSTPQAEKDAIDFKILHQEPYIDERYNQTYIYALPRGPRAIFVFYEVSAATKDHLKSKFGEKFLENNYLLLRVRKTENGHSWEIEDYIDQKNNYWVNVDPNVEYEVELGYRSKGTKFFERIAVSNRCRTQPEGETKHESQNEWREVKIQNYSKEIPVAPNEWRWNMYDNWKKGKANRAEEKGCWALILHMHLPLVRHLEYDVALEEQWLFEAITSCYAPLLNMMWNLERDKVDFRLTVSISPPLITMLEDPELQNRYRRFLDESLALANSEFEAHKGKAFQHTIQTLIDRIDVARKIFEAYKGNILHGFRDFQNLEKLEVMCCAGTHPILPYYVHYPEIVRGHIQMSCRQYNRVFGRWPRGMWLPENAFVPGLDHFLAAEGIKWTLVNATGMGRGNTRPWYGTARPVVTHNNLAVFGIDEDTRAQVWSREAGYPGDGRYKEWYRDVGYDAAWDYLPEYWKVGNCRRNTGLKYYRITGKNVSLHQKAPYNPDWAAQAVAEQAGQFVFHRGSQANHQRGKYNIKPITASAYDAELFGHWWEEGPAWIEMVFRKMLFDQAVVRPVTPSEFLCEQPKNQLLMPGMSTWGAKATFETWLDGRGYRPNVWVYRHLFRLSEQMVKLATERKDATGIERRALNQAAREVMLSQASDWPFLISMDQSSRYAEVRLIKHIDRAKELLRQIEQREINPTYLATVESTDVLLKEDMDFRIFCRG